MITSLRCENFKCFKDTKFLDFAPLTLLVGENNSGKSAIIQALHLPALTLQCEDKGMLLNLVSEEYDYGSFSDIIFKHNENEQLTLHYGIRTQKINAKEKVEAQNVIMSVTFGYLPKRKEIYLNKYIISDEQGEKIRITLDKYKESKKMYIRDHSEDLSYISRLFNRSNFFFVPRDFYLPTEEKLNKKYGKNLSKKIMKDLYEYVYIVYQYQLGFSGIYHVGPLRIPARRSLLYTGSFPEKVGSKGERVLQYYSALMKRGKKEDKRILQLINTALFKLGFIKKFEIRSIGPRLYEFWTQHKKSSLDASLADTGFGASQVLPVLVSLYSSPNKSTLLYEQPEIHLHPAAQAELGSIFAKECTPKKRIIIETHSENLILRIQTEIAKKNLSPSDVVVYYLQPNKSEHKIIELPLDEKGQFLKEWPKGFFEEGYKESLKLLKARQSK